MLCICCGFYTAVKVLWDLDMDMDACEIFFKDATSRKSQDFTAEEECSDAESGGALHMCKQLWQSIVAHLYFKIFLNDPRKMCRLMGTHAVAQLFCIVVSDLLFSLHTLTCRVRRPNSDHKRARQVHPLRWQHRD